MQGCQPTRQQFYCCSVAQSCLTLCKPMNCSMPVFLSFTIYWNLLRLMFTESMMLSKHLILCCPHLLLPSIFPSIKVFSSESGLHTRWAKYWSFSFSNSPYNEYSGLISFRTDWFDLLAVQGTLKSLLYHHSLKALIVWCSVFLMIQLVHPYRTTGEAIALATWTFVGNSKRF